MWQFHAALSLGLVSELHGGLLALLPMTTIARFTKIYIFIIPTFGKGNSLKANPPLPSITPAAAVSIRAY